MYQSGPGYYRVASKARGRGPDVDDRRHRRRHPALVAPRRRLPRGPPNLPHARAGHALVQPNEQYLRTGRPSRTSACLVAAEHRFLRARRRRRRSSTRRIPASCTRSCARGFRICRCTSTISSRNAASLRTLILPNIGAMSDAQAAVHPPLCSERRIAGLATGRTALYNEWGDPRPDFALADLFACHWA